MAVFENGKTVLVAVVGTVQLAVHDAEFVPSVLNVSHRIGHKGHLIVARYGLS